MTFDPTKAAEALGAAPCTHLWNGLPPPAGQYCAACLASALQEAHDAGRDEMAREFLAEQGIDPDESLKRLLAKLDAVEPRLAGGEFIHDTSAASTHPADMSKKAGNVDMCECGHVEEQHIGEGDSQCAGLHWARGQDSECQCPSWRPRSTSGGGA